MSNATNPPTPPGHDGIDGHDPNGHDPVVHDPKTGAPMDKVHINAEGGTADATDAHVTVDRNPETGAVWLDGGELALLLGLTEKPRDLVKTIDPSRRARNAPMGTQPLACPRDGAELVVVGDTRKRHVEFEACPVCGGVYFDAGELRQISAASVKDRLRAMLR